jgi:hypothetical protein
MIQAHHGKTRKIPDIRFTGACLSGLDVDQMLAAIATGLSGILNEFLAVLHGVRDDLCLGLLALLADFLADDAKWRGVLTDFHDNSPHFARSIKENYPFRIDGSIFLSDILHHKISLSDYKKLQHTMPCG